MKVSLNLAQWYTDVDLKKPGIDVIVQKIGAQLGGVDEVIDLSEKYKGILVAKVVSCLPHPNADKLKVCMIDDGGKVKGVKRDDKKLVQVVCGAPNVRDGLLVAWLPPETTVPSSVDKEPLVLGARDIRGETSNGMLASAKELDISDDHSGLLEIDEAAKPGDDFAKLYGLDDHIIDIENKMFTHRPDCFGILGVARELAGIQQQAFTSPDWYTREPSFAKASQLPFNLKVEAKSLVPRFMAVAMTVNPEAKSPIWLQSYLNRVGIRSINLTVDITNYLMYLTAQPLHAYDYDKVKALSGSTPTLVAREAKKGDKIAMLNGKTIEFEAPTLMVATDKQAIGVIGVMGGTDTEVDENTRRIILECASFDLYSIRRTSMKYGLFTEAVTRFTKGQSPYQTDRVIAKAMSMLSELAGAEVGSAMHDVKHNLPVYERVSITAEYINDRLGSKLSTSEITKLLENVEFKVATAPANKSRLHITPPVWRPDISIPEDIVEEVGRLYGYDRLPVELPKRSIDPTPKDPAVVTKHRLRDILSDAGANEVLTYSFVHGDLMERVGQDPTHAYKLANAISPDLQYYRLSLTPSLLDKVHQNIKAGIDELAIFEINPVHSKDYVDEKTKLPIEDHRLAFVMAAGEKTAQAKYAGAPYYAARKYLDHLLEKLGIEGVIYESAAEHNPKLAISRAAIKPFNKARSALVKSKTGEFIGEIGEFTPEVRQALKLPAYCAGFELDIQPLMDLQSQNAKYTPLSRFPSIEHDLTLDMKSKWTFAEANAVLEESVDQLVKPDTNFQIETLNIYQPDEEHDHKFITWRLRFTSEERTLTKEEITKLVADLASTAHGQLN